MQVSIKCANNAPTELVHIDKVYRVVPGLEDRSLVNGGKAKRK